MENSSKITATEVAVLRVHQYIDQAKLEDTIPKQFNSPYIMKPSMRQHRHVQEWDRSTN